MILINIEKIKQTLAADQTGKLYTFFNKCKEQLRTLLISSLGKEPITPYRTHLLKHPDGQQRINTYLNNFEKALKGDVDIFMEDMKQIGIIRALEGFHLNDVFGYTVAFKEALWQSVIDYNLSTDQENKKLNDNDIFAIHGLLDCSYYLLSLSFFKNRNEIIKRHRNQIQGMQEYTVRMISIFDKEKIWADVTQGVFDIYGLYGTILFFDQQKENLRIRRIIGLQISHDTLKKIARDMLLSPRPLGIDENNVCLDLNSKKVQNEHFKLICAPIKGRTSRLAAILLAHNQGNTFYFSKFERSLFLQFSYFTSAVFANCHMVSEIAQKKEDLTELTGKLISIQEEERKKIAADIHDILTQALTGIGYKALYCMEITDKNPDILKQELNDLTININKALQQSRQIICNLHPRILDDIGIVPAIRQLTNDCSAKFNLKINFFYPPCLNVGPEKGIAIFRILQEALNNIARHAKAQTVDIMISITTNHFIELEIRDNGRGFNPNRMQKSGKNSGMGLLIMKERAEDLGGTFNLNSIPQQGSQINVSIPCRSFIHGIEN
ncbi:MAG: sensor histidine kinase [Desulfobacula sp.]|nr:sensor histidine kinase [Desulfobacula sp.]